MHADGCGCIATLTCRKAASLLETSYAMLEILAPPHLTKFKSGSPGRYLLRKGPNEQPGNLCHIVQIVALWMLRPCIPQFSE